MATSFLVKNDNNTATGTMIGSESLPSRAISRHSPDVEPVVLTPKALTMVKYPLAKRNDELLVISVHAINFQTTEAFKRHMDLSLEEIRKHSGPVLFAGDFNTWNKARMSHLLKSIKKLGLKEVKFKNDHLKMKVFDMPLDHSFIRGLKVKDAEVVYSDGSDHRPLLMEFDVE
jgi:endonuclease/exonuclease/phosphatase (EEP) superfamily protein YafD